MSQNDVYHCVSTMTTSKKDLELNGYPYFKDHEDKKMVAMDPTRYTRGNKLWLHPDEKMRTCCRCHKRFELAKNQIGYRGSCKYHPKGSQYDKVRKCRIHSCCGEKAGHSKGCQKKQLHVFDQLLTTELEKFVETEDPCGKTDHRSRNVLAIDVEMVYTWEGPALARLSVVDWDGHSLLDIKVRPPSDVIDPNTEYSGLTDRDVYSAEDTLETCRQKLLELVNKETILVGHSLEADLRALRLVHLNIIDTSLLYKTGPKKIGLKTLALEHLGMRIQSNKIDQSGHDSVEDARVCLKLLKLRIGHFL